MEHLVIRLHADPATAEWAVFDDSGRVVSRAAVGPLADAAGVAAGRRVIVLVPAVDVISTEATLPKASASRLRKMLPYSLEDALAEDVDDLFFAVGPRLESGAVTVAVVGRERLEAWLGALAESGITPSAVYSDADGVPDTPSTLTVVVAGDLVYGRAPGRPPFVLEGVALEEVPDIVDGSSELRHALVYVDEAASARQEEALRALSERIPNCQVKLMADGALYHLAATITSRPGVNLLQGPYAPKSSIGVLLKPWRVAAGLAAAVLVLGVLAQGVEYLSLVRQDRALTDLLTESCRRDMGAPALDACRAAVRSRLGGRGLLQGPDDGFLSALAVIAEARVEDSRLEALSWRNDVLDLQLTVPDVPALDAFAQAVERSEQFAVRIQSANSAESAVEGRVQLIGAER
ncbi:MAG TPA: type II secretion system protein GspL [Gammaproteobacteria bacterium]